MQDALNDTAADALGCAREQLTSDQNVANSINTLFVFFSAIFVVLMQPGFAGTCALFLCWGMPLFVENLFLNLSFEFAFNEYKVKI